jgi:hypothetical protein
MYSSSMPLGPGGVDVLRTLAGKMEQQLKDTEQVRTSFDADIRRYKDKQISKKEFVHRLVVYTISLSALNFLVMHVILEMRTAIEKGTSMKDFTGGTVTEDSSTSGSQFSSGIQGFVGGSFPGGSGDGGDLLTNGKTVTLRSDINNGTDAKGSRDRIGYRKDQNFLESSLPKECIGCGTVLIRNTNFCGSCGHEQ